MATRTKQSPTAKKTRAKRAKSAPVSNDLLTVFVLDDSGSMNFTIGVGVVVESVDDYIGGLREDEKEAEGKTLLSMYAINKGAVHVADPLEDIPSLGTWYRADGGTPLFDGIAHSLIAAEKKLVELGQPDMKVLHVTVTDGGENQSTDYPGMGYPPSNPDLIALVQEFENLTREERTSLSKDKRDALVASRIEEKAPQGNWTFVYLGAESTREQSVAVASAMGYSAGNAMNYAATPGGATTTMSSLRAATSSRRVSESAASSAFFSDAGQSSADYADPGIAVPATGDVAEAAGVKLESSSLSSRLGGK